MKISYLSPLFFPISLKKGLLQGQLERCFPHIWPHSSFTITLKGHRAGPHTPILQMREQRLRRIYGLSTPNPELLTTAPEILLWYLTTPSMCSVLNKLMNS